MRTSLDSRKRSLVVLAALVCMIVASSTSALAVPNSQIYVEYSSKYLVGKCCYLFGDTARVTEPNVIQPVVVTWTTEYDAAFAAYVGLSINGGPCLAYGPRSLQPYSPNDRTWGQATFQWVITPNQCLVNGTNTFTVCGGAVYYDTAVILLGMRTLTVRFGK